MRPADYLAGDGRSSGGTSPSTSAGLAWSTMSLLRPCDGRSRIRQSSQAHATATPTPRSRSSMEASKCSPALSDAVRAHEPMVKMAHYHHNVLHARTSNSRVNVVV